jgi:hypothetical protein
VVIPLPSGLTLPENAQYMKYQSAAGWVVFESQDGNTIRSAPLTSQGQCPVIGSTAYQSGLQIGGACIELTLVDGGLYDDDGQVNGQIADPGVISTNYAPTLTIDTLSSVDEQTLVTLQANGVDPEGATLTYLWTQTAGETVTLDDATQAVLTFTAPNVTQDTSLTFNVIVSDGTNEVTQSQEITISWVPQALSVIAATSSASANEGTAVTLTGSDSVDPDGYALSYLWSQVSGPSMTLSTPNSANAGFTAPQVTSDSTVVVRLTIMQGSRSASSDISITVKNVVAVTPTPTPKAESGGGATNLYWLMMLLLISIWRIRGGNAKRVHHAA